MRECFKTWRPQDGLPKVHYSDQDPHKRPGGHSDWINADRFAAFLEQTPDRDFDCMLEAKKKDLALLKLRAELASRGIIEERSA
jgi:UV DNA damage endonuclease